MKARRVLSLPLTCSCAVYSPNQLAAPASHSLILLRPLMSVATEDGPSSCYLQFLSSAPCPTDEPGLIGYSATRKSDTLETELHDSRRFRQNQPEPLIVALNGAVSDVAVLHALAPACS